MSHVLVLCFDQLPTWLLGFMGHSEVETPKLDTMACQSFVFDRAYAAGLQVSLPDILEKQSSDFDINLKVIAQSTNESFDTFVEQVLEETKTIDSNSHSLIVAKAFGISESDFFESAPEDEDQIDGERKTPEFKFIEQLDSKIGELFDQLSDINRNWSHVMTASRGFSKPSQIKPENEAIPHALLHIPLIIREPTENFCLRDSRLFDTTMIAQMVLQMCLSDHALSQTINSLPEKTEPRALIVLDPEAGVTWRSHDFCLKLSSRYFEKLKAKEVDFFEKASELEIEEFTCEAALYLKPEDFWEHNNVSSQFPETTKGIFSEILSYARQTETH